VERRSDIELARALAAGDRAAGDALIDRSYDGVFRFLRPLCRGDAARAADAAQEAFRRAWEALGRFEGRSSFATWVCRIAYNVVVDEARRPAPLPLEDPEDGTPFDPPDEGGTLPDEDAARAEESAALRRAVRRLPEELRFAVAARYWAEARLEEIAAVEGITEAAVRKRIKRALELLAEALEAGA